jgi:hypothetical protein
MSVPAFNIHGVLPPFIGSTPGEPPSQMSPYVVAPVDVVNAFGSTADRLDVLTKWLDHRHQLRHRGIESGFQWLDGSFIERKVPKDLDVTTHNRGNFLWKGMLRVDLAPKSSDDIALAAIQQASALQSATPVPASP